MLKGLTPIVRGRCNCCGYSRNLWANELPGQDPLCDHASDRGCAGTLEVAYVGPKAMMPAELDRAHNHCSCGPGPSAPPVASCGPAASSGDVAMVSAADVAQLCDMGFSQDAARQALTVAFQQGGGIEVAVEWLMSDPAGQAAATAVGSGCEQCTADSGGAASLGGGPSEAVDLACCAICTEDLEPTSAAMRCSGQHGKRHYYAMCLNAWIQQCRREKNPPTCPECRGPLQVHERRLRDFLQENSDKLATEDMEALRAMHDAAEPATDGEGWSGISKDKIIKGALIGVGVAAGLAIAAAALGAFSQSSRSRSSRDDD